MELMYGYIYRDDYYGTHLNNEKINIIRRGYIFKQDTQMIQ